MPAASDPISLSGPHADDLALRGMTATERLGRPFAYQLEFESKLGDLAYEDFLGQTVTVGLSLSTGSMRYFNGIVVKFAQRTRSGDWHRYQAELRPWFWLLTRTADCKVFQNLAVPDLFKQVCSGLGFSDYQDSLSGTYSTREYCVQYRETTFDFLSRLLEFEGIYYYFTHDDQKHQLVLSDGVGSHATVSGYENIPFSPQDLLSERVSLWNVAFELQSGKYMIRDYDYLNPTSQLDSKLSVQRSFPHSDLEIYDYPGGFLVTGDGDNFVGVRSDERQSQYQLISGDSDARGLAVGSLFTLTDHPRSDQNVQYLVTSASWSIARKGDLTQDDDTGGVEYHCSFAAVPGAQTYRPERTTLRPVIHGPQTAVVVGQANNEIWTEANGRIKVQFHWDRVGTKDENSSCWIRVAQPWAGNTWGGQFIPRIGDEVVVEFLEGDPDRPLVTGSVYNAQQMPPFVLPDNATQGGLRTRSTQKGDGTTFNELRFEDNKGSEQIFFHAERDFLREVENNDTLTVGIENDSNGNPQVGLAGSAAGNQTVTVFNNQSLTIGKKVGSTAPADGSQTVEIWKNQTVTIGKGGSNCQDGSQTTSIFKDQTITIGNNLTLNVGDSNSADGSQTVNIWKSRTVTLKNGDDSLTVSQGNQTVQIKAGSSSLEAMQSILLKVGDNSIKIASDGITIKGTLIDIEATTGLKAKGLTADVLADAALTLKGGIAKIN